MTTFTCAHGQSFWLLGDNPADMLAAWADWPGCDCEPPDTSAATGEALAAEVTYRRLRWAALVGVVAFWSVAFLAALILPHLNT